MRGRLIPYIGINHLYIDTAIFIFSKICQCQFHLGAGYHLGCLWISVAESRHMETLQRTSYCHFYGEEFHGLAHGFAIRNNMPKLQSRRREAANIRRQVQSYLIVTICAMHLSRFSVGSSVLPMMSDEIRYLKRRETFLIYFTVRDRWAVLLLLLLQLGFHQVAVVLHQYRQKYKYTKQQNNYNNKTTASYTSTDKNTNNKTTTKRQNNTKQQNNYKTIKRSTQTEHRRKQLLSKRRVFVKWSNWIMKKVQLCFGDCKFGETMSCKR